MGSAAEVPVAISSDEEDGAKMPAAGKRKSPEDALAWAEGVLAQEDRHDAAGEGLVCPATIEEFLDSLMDAKGPVVGDKNTMPDALGEDDDDGDDDDCVILDGDPDNPVSVAKEEGAPPRDAADDELQIVAEKGELACRDFPHPRHLCATLPFSTSSHARHCSMCHCYVCDCLAPCAFWVNHCHATDKDARWNKLRQTFKNKNQPNPKRRITKNFNWSITTEPSSQHSANLIGFTGRFHVSGTVSQNQQVVTSIMAAHNMWQGMAINLPSAPSPMPRTRIPTYGSKGAQCAPMPRAKIPSYGSKGAQRAPMPRTRIPSYGSKDAQVAPPRYIPSSYLLQPSVTSYGLVQPARPHASQTAQVSPGAGGHVSAETFKRNPLQVHVGAPIGSQGHQYRPPSYPQLAPNTVVGTGPPLSGGASMGAQGTQDPQVPSADIRLEEALANLAHQLGVPDYNTNKPLGRQSTSTPHHMHMHPGEILLAQGAQKAVHPRVYAKKSNVATTSQIGSSGVHNSSNHAPGGSVLSSGSVQLQQPLCQLKSQSSVTPSETVPNGFNLQKP